MAHKPLDISPPNGMLLIMPASPYQPDPGWRIQADQEDGIAEVISSLTFVGGFVCSMMRLTVNILNRK